MARKENGLFALQAVDFVAAPVSGHLSDRMGPRNIIMASMAMSAVVLVFMALAGRTPALALFVAFLGFFLFATRSVLQAWLLGAVPRQLAGTSIGLLFGAQALRSAIGPLIAGAIGDRFGITAVFYFLAATIVIANLFILIPPRTAASSPVSGSPSRNPHRPEPRGTPDPDVRKPAVRGRRPAHFAMAW